MYAIDVVFKNGHKLEGLVWAWEPELGCFTALDESNGKIKIFQFKDVQEGKFYDDHIRRCPSTKVSDFLEKAIEDGYQPN